jgi:hypothetical protein
MKSVHSTAEICPHAVQFRIQPFDAGAHCEKMTAVIEPYSDGSMSPVLAK